VSGAGTYEARGVRGPLGRVAANAGWMIGANGVILVSGALQAVVLAHALGPSRFGLLAVVLAVVGVIQQFLSSRVWEAAVKFVTEFRSSGEPAKAAAAAKLCLLIDLATGVAAAALLWATASLTSKWFADGGGVQAIRWFALSTIVTVPTATATAILRVGDRFRWLAYQSAGESLTRLVLIALVVWPGGASLSGVVSAYLAASVAAASVVAWLAVRAARDLGLPPLRDVPLSLLRPDLRRILAFVGYTNASGTGRLVTAWADVLILGWFASPGTVGIYRLARAVADPLAKLASPFYQAVYPEVSRLVHDGRLDEVRVVTRRLERIGWAIVLPVCVLLSLAAGWLVPAVFGDRYAAAADLTRIMVWQLVWVPYLWLPGLLLSLGRAPLVAGIAAVDAVVYVLLLLALVPSHGDLGAAVATFGRFAIWTAIAVTVDRRLWKEPE
jgi:O-antigen/teichoic acid export membrane protein